MKSKKSITILFLFLFSIYSTPSRCEGLYGNAVEQQFISLLKAKQYQKAFSMLNPEGIKKSEDSFIIISYDTLNVLINKKNPNELCCNKEYKEYPDAYAYSALICGLLNDYMETGKFSDKRMKRAETYFSEEDKKRKFLLDMVKDIK